MRARSVLPENFGTTMAAKMPRMTMTSISSINVNACSARLWYEVLKMGACFTLEFLNFIALTGSTSFDVLLE